MGAVELETDYLIVGAGAMGMAFADEVLHSSRDARVILVERQAKPGGHWNSAYPFVTLHQPALYYGVNSEKLGSGGGDLVSKSEILEYYDRVLEKLKKTGRFQFFPFCEYQGENRFRTSLEPELEYKVIVHRKTVDATYMNVTVPSTTPPQYSGSDDVTLVPVNGLADLKEPWQHYTVIGAGKTGLDALLYLLDKGVEQERITWIISNDAWFLNRILLMPDEVSSDLPAQLRCIAQSTSCEDVFLRLEKEGRLLRLDPEIVPTKYRCATVTDDELKKLRTLKNIVRQGRVVRIHRDSIELTQGSVTASPNTLYVDCTANGLRKMAEKPIFNGSQITLQAIAMCQQVMSAAALAKVDLRYDDDELKNTICRPVPHPEYPVDYLRALHRTIVNLDGWGRKLLWWTIRSRLSVGHHLGFWGIMRFNSLGMFWKKRAFNKILKWTHQEDSDSVGH